MLVAVLFRFWAAASKFQSFLEKGLAVNAVTILRRPAVEQKTGLSRSAIYALMARNEFPRPTHRLTAKAVGWRSDVIDSWLESREVAA